MDQIKIGKFIAEARRAKDLTQRQLADALSISDKTVSKWENGRGFPEVSLLLPLCEALEISVTELLSGERQSTEAKPEETFREQAEANMVSVVELAQETIVRVETDHRRKTRRLLLTLLFLLSLSPMLLSQFGCARGVQEIKGLIILASPLGVLSLIAYLVGVWFPEKRQRVGYICGGIGALGMIAAEIWRFWTWHYMTITGKISLRHSLNMAYPEFYLGLAISLAMATVYFILARPKKTA